MNCSSETKRVEKRFEMLRDPEGSESFKDTPFFLSLEHSVEFMDSGEYYLILPDHEGWSLIANFDQFCCFSGKSVTIEWNVTGNTT